jgi:hypothetical protein
VRVAAGAEGVLVALQAGVLLRGSVLDESTNVMVPSELTLAFISDSSKDVTLLAPEGSFEIAGLSAGAYILSARSHDNRHGRVHVQVQPGSDELELSVPVRVGASITLLGTEQSSIYNYTILSEGDRIDAGLIMPAHNVTRVVPAGAIEIQWTVGGASGVVRSSIVYLAPGDKSELSLSGSNHK